MLHNLLNQYCVRFWFDIALCKTKLNDTHTHTHTFVECSAITIVRNPIQWNGLSRFSVDITWPCICIHTPNEPHLKMRRNLYPQFLYFIRIITCSFCSSVDEVQVHYAEHKCRLTCALFFWHELRMWTELWRIFLWPPNGMDVVEVKMRKCADKQQ